MTKLKTCKHCEHWEGVIEKRFLQPDEFVNRCQFKESSRFGHVTWDNDTCDKHESKDRQREMRLGE